MSQVLYPCCSCSTNRELQLRVVKEPILCHTAINPHLNLSDSKASSWRAGQLTWKGSKHTIPSSTSWNAKRAYRQGKRRAPTITSPCLSAVSYCWARSGDGLQSWGGLLSTPSSHRTVTRHLYKLTTANSVPDSRALNIRLSYPGQLGIAKVTT